jgi:hypothetical protein
VKLQGVAVIPFGYIQSPLLASIVLDKSALGQEIRNLSKSGIKASVYMDDIILSHESSHEKLAEAIARVESASSKAGFVLSTEKRRGPASAISVFNILVSSDQLELERGRYEEFSRDVLAYRSGPIVDGILSYVESVNETQARSLRQLVKRPTT